MGQSRSLSSVGVVVLLTSFGVGKMMLLLFEVVKGVVVSIFLVTSDLSPEQVWILMLAGCD